MKQPGCPLCDAHGGVVVHQAGRFRVIRADEAGFPAFYRVVWTDHVAEFSDLSGDDRIHCMQAVATVEEALRKVMRPTKVNIAALGNMVPHLHWHVIARFEDDSHFPAPVWAAPQREPVPERLRELQHAVQAVDAEIVLRFAGAPTARPHPP